MSPEKSFVGGGRTVAGAVVVGGGSTNRPYSEAELSHQLLARKWWGNVPDWALLYLSKTQLPQLAGSPGS